MIKAISICLLLLATRCQGAMLKAASCYPANFAECKTNLGITHVVLMDNGSGSDENTNAAALAIAAGLEPILVVRPANKGFPDLRDGGAVWEQRCYQVMQGNPSRYIIIGNEPSPQDALTANGQTPNGGYLRSDFETAAKLVVLQHRIASFVAKRYGKIVIGGAFNIDKTAKRGETSQAFIYSCLDAGLASVIDKLAIHYGPKGSVATDPTFNDLIASIRAKAGGIAIWNTETNSGDLDNPPSNPSLWLQNWWSCNRAAGIELCAWYYYAADPSQNAPENLQWQPTLRTLFKSLK